LGLYPALDHFVADCRQGIKWGRVVKRVAYLLVLAAGLASSAATAAPAPSPWDVAITAALMTDYNFRGITQSAHNPSTQAGFEPRYNFSPMLQGYFGVSGESIDFPNHAAAEVDFYGGIRPTIDKFALDFGLWYYWYPGGDCFNSDIHTCMPSLMNGNVAKSNASFYEWYAKVTYTANDNLSLGLQEWYSPSVANTGASGWYTVGNATLTAPTTWFVTGWGGYVSGDIGYWALGTSDAFYGNAVGLPNGVPYASFWNWDAGFGVTYKAFTLDLRYYDTNLSKGDCNSFTSAQTAGGSGNITPINPAPGAGSNWCGAAYIAKLSFATNLSGVK
jgi:uncharacterized protein (TIGR02001 family)